MTRMIINNVRLAYCHLDQPRASAQGGEPKYSVTCIIPKDHPQIAEIKAAIKEAAAQKFGANTKGLKNALRDGDELDAETKERLRGPEFAGAYLMGATSKRPVEVVVGKARTAPSPEHLVSGHYASVKVGFFGYEASGNRGVAAGLNGVWITRRGEPLGAASEPWSENVEAEDFATVVAKANAAGITGAADDMF